MSSTLYYLPDTPQGGIALPDELKYVISRRLWDTDGSTGHGEAGMCDSDIPYLEGLRDAGIKGAKELIKAIEKHGGIILWHEH